MGDVIKMHRGRDAPRDQMAGWLRRADRLQAACSARAPFSADDQARAAANLHGLLERLEREGVRKREVVVEAGLERDPTDSTKRLDTITLPPGAAEKRRNRLAKKPTLYFKVAEAIGSLRNESAAPYLCAIFEGCSFGVAAAFATDTEEAPWIRFADQMRRMSASVALAEDVARYWREIRQANGAYDHFTETFRISNDRIDFLSWERGLADCVVYPGDMPPVPSALIGVRAYSDWQEHRLNFRSGGHLDVRAQLQTEVRLALAPAHSDGKIAPLLEFRSRLDMVDLDGRAIIPDNRYSDGSGGSDTVASVLVEGVWREVVDFVILDGPGPEFRHEYYEACYRSWEPVSAAKLRELFGDGERPFQTAQLIKGDFREDKLISRFTVGSPAFALNMRILNGELETTLAEECRRLRRMLDEHQEALADAIARSDAEADARWSSTGDMDAQSG